MLENPTMSFVYCVGDISEQIVLHETNGVVDFLLACRISTTQLQPLSLP